MGGFAVLVHLFILILCCTVFQCTAQDSRTFFGNDSFVRYPAWNADPQRILRFTFQTSELNALVLYSSGAEDFLLIRLINGSLLVELSLRLGEVQTENLGIFLNDNQPHTLTVYHDPSTAQFEYKLDSDPRMEMSYASNLVPAFGPNGVFLGGVPNSSPLANQTFFIGCLQSVLFSSSIINRSDVDSSTLQSVMAVQVSGRVQDGCQDPCSARDCGAGVCVSRWPDRAFCDCSDTGMLGEDCNQGECDVLF